jgi:DNA-3-methyladenine glycosylase I
MDNPRRCPWPGDDAQMLAYHDHEWGTPVHDDRRLFEFLVLEGAQAGLSWATILHKREGYRIAFDGLEPALVARYDEARIADLLSNPAIVRNRLKVRAAVTNARAFLEVQSAFGSFDAYLWRYVEGRTVHNAWRELHEIPTVTPLAETISRDLKGRGFAFVGPTICYAYMQAVGLVNDHLVSCFRWQALREADQGR